MKPSVNHPSTSDFEEVEPSENEPLVNRDDSSADAPKKAFNSQPHSSAAAALVPVPPPRRRGGMSNIARIAATESCLIVIGIFSLIISSTTWLAIPWLFAKILKEIATTAPSNCTSPPPAGEPMLFLSEGLAEEHGNGIDIRTTYWYCAALVGVMVVGGIFSFVRGFCFNYAGTRVVCLVRMRLFASIVQQEIGFFDENMTGDLLNRLSSDCKMLETAATTSISMFLRSLFQIAGSLVMLIIISPELTGAMAATVPPTVIGLMFLVKALRKQAAELQDALAEGARVAEEVIAGMRTVRGFGQEPAAVLSYQGAIDKSCRIGRWGAFLYGMTMMVAMAVGGGAAAGIIWFGAYLVINGKLNTATLTSFVFYTLYLSMGLAMIAGVAVELVKAVGATDHVFTLINRHPQITPGTTLPPTSPSGASGSGDAVELPPRQCPTITFKDVTFAYPARPDIPVLKNFSLTIPGGKVVALVGPSGSGKSTVLSLIQRFYVPNSGAVYLDDVDIADLSDLYLRRSVLAVAQEPVLFSHSIADNISLTAPVEPSKLKNLRDSSVYGDEIESMFRKATFNSDRTFNKERKSQRVAGAAEASHVTAFAKDLSEGLDTLVGERGIQLSGGQKQRVAIARVLFSNPDVVLLDEATSALDAESEHLVQQALSHVLVGRTVVIVAHRLSTIRNADILVVLDRGCIVETGTHDSLIAKGGAYAQLLQRQLFDSKE